MSLPNNDLPTFSEIVPSTKQEVFYRPFTVKEQRNLMMAIDEELPTVYRTMKDSVTKCTFGKLDVDKLPHFDLEYLFLQIRIKSIGESLPVDLKCPKCGHKHYSALDLTKAKIENLDLFSDGNIKLSEKLYVKMRYPSLEEIGQIEGDKDGSNVFKVIRDCIENIYTDTAAYAKGDFNDDELRDWLENCTDDQFSNIEMFILNAPSVVLKQTEECPKCASTTEYTLKGIKAFFD